MSEFLSPGIFIEEVASRGEQVTGVGTSAGAVVGWTKMGPTDRATLVTSRADFERRFGGFTKSSDSLVPHTVHAFFDNGGQRMYVVRAAPSDAEKSEGCVKSADVVNENPSTDDGSSVDPEVDGANTDFEITLANSPLSNDSITIQWTDTSDQKSAIIAVDGTVSGDDSADINSASVNKEDAVISVEFSSPPDEDSIELTYTYCLWSLEAKSEGAWGNRLKLQIAGDEDSFVSGTVGTDNVGQYTAYNVSVLVEDETTGDDVVRESYEEVVFDDEDDARYFLDLLNESSDFVLVQDNSHKAAPPELKGEEHEDENIATGDGDQTEFTHTLQNTPVVKTSLEIKYTVGATEKTATADVDGNITGDDLDDTKTNSVDYESGEVTLNFSTAPDDTEDIEADYVSRPEETSVTYELSGGDNGTLPLTRNDVSSPTLKASKKGMFALDRVDELMQLVMPDFISNTTVIGDQIDYAENRQDIFVILSIPKGFSAQQAADHRRITFTRKSKYSAWYWPHVTITDPLNDTRELTMPAIGHVAGIYARTDATRNVGKAPGGTVDGALRFLTGLEVNPDKGERDTVYPSRINPLVNTPQTGMAVWGVRTASATNDVFRYVNAVRLFQFVQKSVFNSTHSLVFESVGPDLYSRIQTKLDSFLLNLFEEGHFAGSTPRQAYFVTVDETNNPPEVVNQGQVVVDVGIAPNRPGEFIRFRFAEKTLNS